jgi:photosystem II stability/assembly factor-like uncharacterized protein
MKTVLTFFMFFLFTNIPLFSQWERVHLPDGVVINQVLTRNNVSLAYNESDFYKSYDGISWKSIELPQMEKLFRVFFEDSIIVIQAKSAKIYKSSDYGDNWTEISLPKVINYDTCNRAIDDSYVFDVDKSEVMIYYWNQPNIMYTSSNYGQNWTMLNGPSENDKSYSSYLIIDGNIAAGNSSGIFFKQKGGSNWILIDSQLKHNYLSYLHKSGNNLLLYANSVLFRSLDDGLSWQVVRYDSNLVTNELLKEELKYNNPNYFCKDSFIFCSLLSSTVLKSTDYGATWNKIFDGYSDSTFLDLHAFSDNYSFFTKRNHNYNVSAVLRNKLSNSNTLENVLKNQGLTFYPGLFSDGRRTFASYADTLLLSLNDGDSWIYASSGMTLGIVDYIFSTGKCLIASTYDKGLLISKDNGITWLRENRFGSHNLIDVKRDGDNVYLAFDSGKYGFSSVYKCNTSLDSILQLGDTDGFTVSKQKFYRLNKSSKSIIVESIKKPFNDSDADTIYVGQLTNGGYSSMEELNGYIFLNSSPPIRISINGDYETISNVPISSCFTLKNDLYSIEHKRKYWDFSNEYIGSIVRKSNDNGDNWTTIFKYENQRICDSRVPLFGRIDSTIYLCTIDGIYVNFQGSRNKNNWVHLDSSYGLYSQFMKDENSLYVVNESRALLKKDISKIPTYVYPEIEHSAYCQDDLLFINTSYFGKKPLDDTITLELSNQNGRFNNSLILGKNVGVQKNSLTVRIPKDVIPSSAYRIRATCTDCISLDNGYDIQISEIPKISLSGKIVVPEFTEQIYSTSYSEGSEYNWEIIKGDAFIETKSRNIASIFFKSIGQVQLKLTIKTTNGCIGDSIFNIQVKSLTNIEDEPYYTFLIYPNPTSTQVIIDCGDNTEVSTYSYTITNSLGQEKLTSKFTSRYQQIDISGIGGTGLYIITIKDGNDTVLETRKLIIQ